jgi:PIN domain nuclease of toxin-antitoxin system
MNVRLLLDTHIFLWFAGQSARLNAKARYALDNADEIYVSSVSIWEIAIKFRLGKLKVSPDAMIDLIDRADFKELPVFARHAAAVARLPLYHGDPFDRLLVAQAIFEDLHLVTADRKLAPYSDQVVLV